LAETYIEPNASDENMDDMYMSEEGGRHTPELNEEKAGSEHHTGLEEDEDESVFVSPLKAHKKPAPVADSDSKLTGTDSDDGGFEAKRKGNKKTDMGKRSFREMVQEKRAMTTANNKQALIKHAGNSKVRLSTSDF
jgi:hypothetical protein